jgi:hypothetical protein
VGIRGNKDKEKIKRMRRPKEQASEMYVKLGGKDGFPLTGEMSCLIGR